jgi:RNA polymerase sigma factor (sigma-70 family)
LNQETAFVEMIKENETLIFKITVIYSNSEEDKQDLYQEIVLQLWRSFKKFRQEAKASTWIYRIALNTAISRLRKEINSTYTVSYNAQVHSFIDTQDTVLEERSKELHTQIARLNDIEKAIILLYLENKSHSEIALITGITASNVSTRMVRIKEKLKKKITKH